MCSPARSVRQTAPRPARRQRCSGKTVNGQTTTYTTQTASNRLSSLAGAEAKNFVYDPAGNLIQDGTATYTYDNAGRRTGATVAGQSWQYAYNALGQRVKKSGSTTTLYAYDEQGRLLGEYGATGQPLQETVWLDDLPVATLRGSAVYYVHADHLGTPRRITRPADNTVMWQWESEPFGYSNPNENPQGQGSFTYNLRFPGQLRDAETGLFYNYFRDYDPQTGRYVQSDPIGLEGGSWSTYTYADNAPTMKIDPMGLATCPGGAWDQAFGDFGFQLAGGSYFSVSNVNLTCRTNQKLRCEAKQVCIGGGAIAGAGLQWALGGALSGTDNSAAIGGWGGWGVSGGVGPVGGQGGGDGIQTSLGVNWGWKFGVAAIRCFTYAVKCRQDNCPVE